MYPFHVQRVEALQPSMDCERREAFCEWLLQRDESLTFLTRVLLMDEACFTRNETGNQQTWPDENPHSFQETRFQQKFAINV
jgi:hypothetical protein